MIEARSLTKQFGKTLAVDHLSFTVEPGRITGFLGPNGAGKSTTMRMIVGLDEPTSGGATINGRSFRDAPAPMREVGALLDAKGIDGSRSARAHLRWLAIAGGIDRRRIDEVLDLVGLTSAADKRVKDYSLGMYQRLGLASALLGDPGTLLFDEPFNGLDPQGIYWMRGLLRDLAREGRVILVSSHLMSEMEETADHVIVIGKGKLIADTSISDFTHQSTSTHVRVNSPDASRLAGLLRQQGITVNQVGNTILTVAGTDAAAVGDLAADHGLRLHELSLQRATLESAFMEMTDQSVEYRVSPDTRELVGAGANAREVR